MPIGWHFNRRVVSDKIVKFYNQIDKEEYKKGIFKGKEIAAFDENIKRGPWDKDSILAVEMSGMGRKYLYLDGFEEGIFGDDTNRKGFLYYSRACSIHIPSGFPEDYAKYYGEKWYYIYHKYLNEEQRAKFDKLKI